MTTNQGAGPPRFTGGASAAYRGYRGQLSYTLARVLTASDAGLTFQPEGVEDLGIWRGDQLIEACQIKGVSGALQPSHLRSKSGSFFRRGAELLHQHPAAVLRIVSFGPFASEFETAVGKGGAAANALARKLQDRDGLSLDDAMAVVGRIKLERVDEARVAADLQAAAEQLLTAADATASLDLLHWWMFLSAEEQRRLAPADVRDAVVNTGKYVSGWSARHADWFTTIEPLMPVAVGASDQDRLAAEFYRGIAARPEHIAAGLDVERPEILGSIDDGFAVAQVVVVRGASGQGKSTVALRYLSGLPEPWRFRVRRVDDRSHAARIALALTSQAQQIRLPLIVWIDVSPRDVGWADLVARLVEEPNVRVLVTIREEDWKRSQLPGGALNHTEIELDFNRSEASHIFSSLVARHAAGQLLDFDEAWAKFGGQGPLLEFVHLVTQDASLRERLAEQVTRLEDDVRSGALQAAELELLRSVAVATAYEAQVDIALASHALNMPAARRSVERFEREYLLRSSGGGHLLAGLHPIRSTILAELLCDPALHPWPHVARRVLPWIVEADLEVFLMSAFVQRPEARPQVLAAVLELGASSWTGLAGVGRALLWLGIAEYAELNRPWIDSLIAEHGEAAWLAINRDVAGAMPGTEDIMERLADLVPNGEGLRGLAAQAKRQQTSPDEIWTHLRPWVGKRDHSPASPSDEEWGALGQVCFWAGHLSMSMPAAWVRLDEADPDEAELGQLADATFGLAEAGLSAAIEFYRPRLIERFQRETLTVRLSDDCKEVKADFIVPLDTPNEPTDPCARSTNFVHAEAMRRAWLLRRLYPNHEFYACQGFGHRILDGQHDDTTKRIPRRNLPPDWLTSINATFAGYLERPVRPPTWTSMAHELVARRQAVLEAFAAIERALVRYHRSSDDVIIGRSLDYGVIERALRALAGHVRLPAAAVDPWGLVTEGRREDAAPPELGTRRPLALDRHRGLVSATRRWNQAAENFLRAAGQVLATTPLLARRAKDAQTEQAIRDAAAKGGIRADLGPLSRLNLRDAMKSLAEMQRELRATIGLHLPPDADSSFDAVERDAYLRVASIWEQFTRRPAAHIADVVGQVKETRAKALRRFTQTLAKSRSPLTNDVGLALASSTATWCGQPVVAVIADARESALSLIEAGDEMIEWLASAAKDVGGETAQKLFGLAWPAVVLIWTFRGRALDTAAFHLETAWLQESERKPDWWRFVPKVRPNDFVGSAPTEIWDSAAATDGATLVAAVADVWTYASHLADLIELGDIEGEGEAIIRRHLDLISGEQSLRLQAAIDALSSILELAELHASSDHAAALVATCRQIHSMVLPIGFSGGEGRIRMSEVAAWRDSVAEARSHALAARLLALTTASD